jgi:hypothetical protein
MRKANIEETLRVFHTLWKKGQIETARIRQILLTNHLLLLTSITLEGITTETQDGTQKYTINQ